MLRAILSDVTHVMSYTVFLNFMDDNQVSYLLGTCKMYSVFEMISYVNILSSQYNIANDCHVPITIQRSATPF